MRTFEQQIEDELGLELPVIFLYSKAFNQIESNLILIKTEKDLDCLNSLQLRCRFNSHRDLKVMVCYLSEKTCVNYNEKLKEFEDDTIKESILKANCKELEKITGDAV